MPFYSYKCSEGHTHDLYRKIDQRMEPAPCPVCHSPGTRDIAGEHVNAQNDFEHPVYSEALGVHPSQIAESRSRFPHHDFTPDGRLIIRSTQERERIRRDLGFTD